VCSIGFPPSGIFRSGPVGLLKFHRSIPGSQEHFL
jgi:hypothetical protein